MRIERSQVILAVFATAVGLGWGCGGTGAGCGLQPLPKDPAPFGMPSDQVIEGGMQVRLTKPGFAKISALIPELVKKALGAQQCIPTQKQQILGFVTVTECGDVCGNGHGCPVNIALRPDLAPPGGIAVTIPDSGNDAVVHIDAAFDVSIPIALKVEPLVGKICDLTIAAPGTHINADIKLGTDPNTGELTINLGQLQLLNLKLAASNCGVLSDVFNLVLGLIDLIINNNLIGGFIVNLLKPMLNNLIMGFLPKPPGMAGTLPMGQSLASLGAPKTANLETFLVAGGYVSAYSGGLNLGVMTGFNSDRDPSTRGPGLGSEPSLCVPGRKTYDFSAAPWMLPLNAARRDFNLNVAAEFSGQPDPMDMNGMVKDLAIGMSRTTLDLAGFHLYNSGSLCLEISGGALAALNAGAVSVIVPSLANILENRKGPLALVVRPENPLKFQIGAGTMADPLLHVAVQDIRIDFYAFIEERFVRIFTLSLDMNVGLNLSLTMTKDGKPALQPMITGIDKTSVMARALNTDLLEEDPNVLAKSLLSLIDLAVGQLTGGINPIALPSLSGFSLDGLELTRVQTKQDDFLAIYGDLVQDPMMMPAKLPDGVVPPQRQPHAVDTSAQVVDVSVPPVDVIRAALLADRPEMGSLPSVTVALGGNSGHLEWSYRVDGSAWHAWSSEARPTLHDPAFVLQARHAIDVKARMQGDWLSEDPTPVSLSVVIDSVPPELHPSFEDGRVSFHGWDNVSDDGKLKYAWDTPHGFTEFGPRSSMSHAEALAATQGGNQALQVKVLDEAGNVGFVPIDLGPITSFHGRTTDPPAKGGCGCALGAAPRSRGAVPFAAILTVLGAALARRRRFGLAGRRR